MKSPIFIFFTLFLLAIIVAKALPDHFSQPVYVIAEHPQKVQLDPRFLSFSLDTSVIVGGQWWSPQFDGATELGEPIDLDQAKLNFYAQKLAPAYLRIGGTEADSLYLQLADEPRPEKFHSSINAERVQQVADFVDRNQLDWMLTLNYGPGTHQDNQWQTAQLSRWLDLFEQRQFNLPIFELGNEVLAHWIFYGFAEQQSMDKYVSAYNEAKTVISDRYPEHQLAGPANAFWPWIGEPGSTMFGGSKTLLAAQPDVFTWHFYSTQSPRCSLASYNAFERTLLSDVSLKESKQLAQKIQNWQLELSPNTQLWLGETGPAQCGGVPELTDRFISSIWWLSHLGVMAYSGQEVVVRQALYGSDYGLLNKEFSPNPDFWASWLWKQLMGEKVLWVDRQIEHGIRAFAHCQPNDSGQLTMLLVNATGQDKTRWLPNKGRILTATSPKLKSDLTLINGFLVDALGFDLQAYPWQSIEQEVNLPAHSWSFIELPGDGLCQS